MFVTTFVFSIKRSELTDIHSSGENLGCFGASKKKKDGTTGSSGLGGNQKESASSSRSTSRNEPIKGMELLWQPEVIHITCVLDRNLEYLKTHYGSSVMGSCCQ